MLGIDLYQQYNLVTDWHQVHADGITDVYVKLTDGGGPARVRGDNYVAGARAAGCKVGGYHYMEASPSPEAQADVFAAELRRLGALDIAPALDLEEPSIPVAVRADYGRRFLRRLQSDLNVAKVAVYASASWMATLQPDSWGISGLVPWVAAYGPDDGREHPISGYVGHVTVHQYTSTGHLPGISGAVDLDDVLADVTEEVSVSAPLSETTTSYQALIWDIYTVMHNVADVPHGPNAGTPDGHNALHDVLATISAKLDALSGALSADEAALLAAIKSQPTGGQVDVTGVAAALAPVLAPLLPAEATPQQIGAAVETAFAAQLGKQ